MAKTIKELEGELIAEQEKNKKLQAANDQLTADNKTLKETEQAWGKEKEELTGKLETAEKARDHFNQLNTGYAAANESLILLAMNNGLKLIEKDGVLNTDRQTPAVDEIEKSPLSVQMPVDLQELHNQRTKTHGENYVVAKKGNLQTVFSSKAWKDLGSDKAGWKQFIETPPEVKALGEKNKGGK